MSVKELCDIYEVNKEDLYLKLNIDPSYSETSTLKELKDIMIIKNPDFDMEKIRGIVEEMIE